MYGTIIKRFALYGIQIFSQRWLFYPCGELSLTISDLIATKFTFSPRRIITEYKVTSSSQFAPMPG